MFRLLRSLLKREEGSCLRCGRCCRSLYIVDHGRPICDEEHLARYARRNPWARRLVPLGLDDDGMLKLRCVELGEDGLCQIHGARPKECREYPDREMIGRHGGELLEGCGYGPNPGAIAQEPPSFEEALCEAREELEEESP